MQNRVKAYAVVDRLIVIFFKSVKEALLFIGVKSVNNFIGKSHKPVNAVNGIPDLPVEEAHRS